MHGWSLSSQSSGRIVRISWGVEGIAKDAILTVSTPIQDEMFIKKII
jgi:hypothetical protein